MDIKKLQVAATTIQQHHQGDGDQQATIAEALRALLKPSDTTRPPLLANKEVTDLVTQVVLQMAASGQISIPPLSVNPDTQKRQTIIALMRDSASNANKNQSLDSNVAQKQISELKLAQELLPSSEEWLSKHIDDQINNAKRAYNNPSGALKSDAFRILRETRNTLIVALQSMIDQG